VNARGITLLEMLVVVGIIAALAGLVYAPVTAGIDSLRLNSATGVVAGVFNEALNRADRRQQVVEVTISKPERALWLRSTEPGFEKKITLPEGVSIRSILPEPAQAEEGPRRFLLYPGGAVPRIGVELANARNARRVVRLDPITGVPRIERAGR
jgi:general secretion pathway protein H